MERKILKKYKNLLYCITISIILLLSAVSIGASSAYAFFENQARYAFKHSWLPMLIDESPEKRFQAMQAFLNYPDWGLPVLRNSIKSLETENLSWQIGMLIGMLGDQTDVPSLLKLLPKLEDKHHSTVWLGSMQRLYWKNRIPDGPPLKLKGMTINYLKVSGGIFKDMMIHDFDLLRFYLEKDEIENIFTTASNISDKRFDKIKDYELASCLLKSKQGVQCIITNSRHCSFGYDQRVELFGSKGMLISGNKSENETEIFTKNNTSQKKPLLNFFIDRYVDAYRLQLDELALYSRKKKSPISSFEDGRRALIIANAASQSLKQRKQIKIKF